MTTYINSGSINETDVEIDSFVDQQLGNCIIIRQDNEKIKVTSEVARSLAFILMGMTASLREEPTK